MELTDHNDKNALLVNLLHYKNIEPTKYVLNYILFRIYILIIYFILLLTCIVLVKRHVNVNEAVEFSFCIDCINDCFINEC